MLEEALLTFPVPACAELTELPGRLVVPSEGPFELTCVSLPTSVWPEDPVRPDPSEAAKDETASSADSASALPETACRETASTLSRSSGAQPATRVSINTAAKANFAFLDNNIRKPSPNQSSPEAYRKHNTHQLYYTADQRASQASSSTIFSAVRSDQLCKNETLPLSPPFFL